MRVSNDVSSVEINNWSLAAGAIVATAQCLSSHGLGGAIRMDHRRKGNYVPAHHVGLRYYRTLASLRQHLGLLVVVVIFILLAMADNLLTPPFEGGG